MLFPTSQCAQRFSMTGPQWESPLLLTLDLRSTLERQSGQEQAKNTVYNKKSDNLVWVRFGCCGLPLEVSIITIVFLPPKQRFSV